MACRPLGVVLGLLTPILALGAFLIHFVSASHGHGLASQDVFTASVLVIAALASGLGAVYCLWRRR